MVRGEQRRKFWQRTLVMGISTALLAGAAVGCSSERSPVEAASAGECVDSNAENPTLMQMLEGFRDAMVDGRTGSEADNLRSELEPEKQRAELERVGTAPKLTVVLDKIPAGGYRAYVGAVCPTEKQWDAPLDYSRIRWGLAWDGVQACALIVEQPSAQRDSFVDAADRDSIYKGTDAATVAERGISVLRAARQHLCPY
ncbi:hypothetical protein [Nocardia asiatica]|uniref:hypothetical protein n=1 Tax=Nocardia asiatica TaxID=209252 RepID=UPI003EDEC104